jgi:hypothetical protein
MTSICNPDTQVCCFTDTHRSVWQIGANCGASAGGNRSYVQNSMVGGPARGPFRKVATHFVECCKQSEMASIHATHRHLQPVACMPARNIVGVRHAREPFTAPVWHQPRSPLMPLSPPLHPVAGAQLQYNTTLRVASATAVQAATVRILGASQNAAFSLRALEHT